jgi:hypothetical protein
MNSFQVIIDYNYRLSSTNFIGEGMNGKVYKYVSGGVDYIIKQDNYMSNITYTSIYSDSKKFTLDEPSNINFNEVIKKYEDMASVVNNIKHFVKIKGFVIFPNLTYTANFKSNNKFYSVIYEYVGNLSNEEFLLNKENVTQLLEIFESFKQFNLSGYFHDDIQGCNNIEYNKDNKQLYILDYDVYKYKDDEKIKLERILVNLYKFITCVIRYQSNNKIQFDKTSEGQVAIDIMHEYLKNKPTILDTDSGEELKIKKMNGFYYQEDEVNKKVDNIKDLLKLYNLGLFNNVVDGAILYRINTIFAGFIDKLKSISITVDYNRFSHLLENYIDNYDDIMNFLQDISNNKGINSNEKEILLSIINEIKSIVVKSILLFLNTTYVYFKDIKYIINSIYDKYIEQFNSSVVSKIDGPKNNIYYQKYMKYKNKYLQLKNTK